MAKTLTFLALFSAMFFLGMAAHGEDPSPEPREDIKAACTRMMNISKRNLEKRTEMLLPLGLGQEKAHQIAKMSELRGFNLDACVLRVEIALGLKAEADPSR